MLNLYKLPYCSDCAKKISSDKGKNTCLKKYGVSNASKTQDVIDKIDRIFKEKYGIHPKQTKEVQEKWKKTCLEKYGGHPNQNASVQAKAEENAYKYKDYKLPSGKVVKVQGYEDQALNELLEYFDEDDIIIGRGNIPRISYKCDEGIHRIYFPDFYIESMNTILEIKSEWTLKLKTCRLTEKAKAVKEEGFDYEVWVYDNHKKNKRILKF